MVRASWLFLCCAILAWARDAGSSAIMIKPDAEQCQDYMTSAGSAGELRARADEIQFMPLSEGEFSGYYVRLVEAYASTLVESGLCADFKQALNRSRKTIDSLLPNGIATKGQFLFHIQEGGGQRVGLIWYSEFVPNKGSAWLCDILIEPRFRRQGYARAALKKMESHLRSIGQNRVGLNTFHWNTAAIRLYESLGYVVIGTILQANSEKIGSYQFSKDL